MLEEMYFIVNDIKMVKQWYCSYWLICIFYVRNTCIKNVIHSSALPKVDHLTCQSLPALHLGIGKLLV